MLIRLVLNWVEMEPEQGGQNSVRSFRIDRLQVDTFLKSQLASASKIVATQKLNVSYNVSAASHKIIDEM